MSKFRVLIMIQGLAFAVLLAAPGHPVDQFGFDVVSSEDLNGDGVRELVVSNPSRSTDVRARGEVWILSGADGSPLRHRVCQARSGGANLVILQDMDGDGVHDYGVGTKEGKGPACVLSGADLAEVASFEHGGLVHQIEDLDNDGRPDLLVGGMRYSSRTIKPLRRSGTYGDRFVEIAGGVGVLHLSNGGVLSLLEDPSPPMEKRVGGALACRLSTPTEVTRLLILMRETTRSRYEDLLVVDMPSRECAYTLKVSHSDAEPLPALAPLGDLTGDGYEEFAVSDHKLMESRLSIRSGMDGAVLRTIRSLDQQKTCMTACALGDVDGDDVPDFAIGEYRYPPSGWGAGVVRAFSGADFSEIYRTRRPVDY